MRVSVRVTVAGLLFGVALCMAVVEALEQLSSCEGQASPALSERCSSSVDEATSVCI